MRAATKLLQSCHHQDVDEQAQRKSLLPFSATSALMLFSKEEKIVVTKSVVWEPLMGAPHDRLESTRINHRLTKQAPVQHAWSGIIVALLIQVAIISLYRFPVMSKLAQSPTLYRVDQTKLTQFRLKFSRRSCCIKRTLIRMGC